uniref:Formylmethanofuran dehydrogenase subunit E domain-containing protein n=1 Tax=Dechloromonas aromatica (strain RCB) TaxID=159087 RepID=Q47A61_DECAR
MPLPDFFAQIPAITLRDPLAELLGAADGGLIEYTFADAVKLAGHSCPTVAGAWLMSVRALGELYGSETPVRGNIAVALQDDLDSGVAGVIASIATLLTGAAGDGGFKGLGGQHARRGLLKFGVAEVMGMRFRRLDTGAAVDCVFRPHLVPADPMLGKLLPGIVSGAANAAETGLFGKLWQDRVKRLLIDHGDDPAVVEIKRIPH